MIRYAVSGNGAEAAVAAGYAPKSAPQQASWLLKRPHVRAALEAERERLRAEARVSPEKVIDQLWHLAQHATQDAAKVSALGHLVRVFGLATERHEVTVARRPLEELPDAELYALARARGASQ